MAASRATTTSWYVDATTNSSGEFDKVWVVDKEDADTIAGTYRSEAAAKLAAEEIFGTQSLTGWRGSLAVIGGALGGAGDYEATGNISPNAITSGEQAGQIGGDFFNLLTSKNLWIRLAEGAVALILLDVGLKAFTNHSVIETVAKKATKGAATAAFF